MFKCLTCEYSKKYHQPFYIFHILSWWIFCCFDCFWWYPIGVTLYSFRHCVMVQCSRLYSCLSFVLMYFVYMLCVCVLFWYNRCGFLLIHFVIMLLWNAFCASLFIVIKIMTQCWLLYSYFDIFTYYMSVCFVHSLLSI